MKVSRVAVHSSTISDCHRKKGFFLLYFVFFPVQQDSLMSFK